MPTLAEIAAQVQGQLEGDGSIEITHACDIKDGTRGGIAYLADPRYAAPLAASELSAVIISPEMDPQGKPAIRMDNPKRGFALALASLYPPPQPEAGIHPSAIIGAEARLGDDVSIGPYVVIGDGAQLGDGAWIQAGCVIGDEVTIGRGARFFPRVVLYDRTVVGEDVIINSGTVVGIDGFGYVTEEEPPLKITHLGRVIIGDQVEIGGNCTIDRGTIGDTVIGDGTKIDDQVHIGHNVLIGRGCLLSGKSGIAGSVTIGDHVILAAQVGVADHVTIGDRAIVAGRGTVRQSLEGGKVYAGDPAIEHPHWMRQVTVAKQLPELFRRIRALEHALKDKKESVESQGE
ncbi:MAG: UDP-3-O-(3-hydroxymyristoyl)glucosamine N-acyltransferase [Candidatus Neomarinimicrobiota bacterium]